jgi:uncharacterized phage protein (TIGR02218 family)
MKSASQALIDLLNGRGGFWVGDLYTVTLASGTIDRFTSADRDLMLAGNIYAAGGLKFARDSVRLVTGLEVDELSVTVMADAAATLAGQSFLSFVRAGGLDGATLALDRAFMPTFGDVSAGAVPLFVGRVSEASAKRTQVKLSVKSALELLNIKLPRNIYQPICLHTVFDAGCGLDRTAFQVTSTVQTGSGVSLIKCALVQAAGTFDLGTVKFTSGANSGVTRTVKAYTPGQFTFALPLALAPAVGDAFQAFPGCDRMQSTCQTKFNNLANFRGFPYIPQPETAR